MKGTVAFTSLLNQKSHQSLTAIIYLTSYTTFFPFPCIVRFVHVLTKKEVKLSPIFKTKEKLFNLGPYLRIDDLF